MTQMFDRRMAVLYPCILTTALNISIYASVFVKMMVDTMADQTGLTDQEKTSKALFGMLGLGVGEIFGSLVFGSVTDKCSLKTTVLLNMLALAIGYTFLIAFGVVYSFSMPLAVAMTFTWGV